VITKQGVLELKNTAAISAPVSSIPMHDIIPKNAIKTVVTRSAHEGLKVMVSWSERGSGTACHAIGT
jgi:hypothetical protein